MRSLIQLAGRVQRHRGKRGNKSNVLVFDTNLRHFLPTVGPDGRPAAIFVRPGFEKERAAADHPFRLVAHRLGKLMAPEEYRVLTALPRIRPRAIDEWQPKQRIVDLEQARMTDCMLPPMEEVDGERGGMNAASGWQHPQAALTGVLSQQQPFRDDAMPTTTLVFLPEEDEERLLLHRVEDDTVRRGNNLYVPIDRSQRHDVKLEFGERIGAWCELDLIGLLIEQAEYLGLPLSICGERLTAVEVPHSEQGWRYHHWLGFGRKG